MSNELKNFFVALRCPVHGEVLMDEVYCCVDINFETGESVESHLDICMRCLTPVDLITVEFLGTEYPMLRRVSDERAARDDFMESQFGQLRGH